MSASPSLACPLQLGIQGLPAAEAGLVRAWVVLASTEPGFAWRLASDGRCDAVLVDGAHLSLRRHSLTVPSHRLCVLGHTDSLPTGAARLERPLRQEDLVGWLSGLSQSLSPSPRGLEASQPPTPGPATQTLDMSRTWRLGRWPPHELLRDSRNRVRIATFLSRRALTLDELVLLSGVDRADCLAFTQVLQQLGLLQAAPQPATAQAAARPTVTVAQAKRPLARPASAFARVVLGLRHRLGLLA